MLLDTNTKARKKKNGLKRTEWWACCGLPGTCLTFLLLCCVEQTGYQLLRVFSSGTASSGVI